MVATLFIGTTVIVAGAAILAETLDSASFVSAAIIIALTLNADIIRPAESGTSAIIISAATTLTTLEFSFGKGIERRCLATGALCNEESNRSNKVKNKPHDSFSNLYRAVCLIVSLVRAMICLDMAVGLTAAKMFGFYEKAIKGKCQAKQ